MKQTSTRQEPKFKTNSFYKIAIAKVLKPTDDSDFINLDRTELFYNELKEHIKNGEIIIININAKMRLGKSTCGFSLGTDIFEMLKEKGIRKKTEKFGIQNVAGDQFEKSLMMRNPNLNNTIIVTDEWNELETGGENATAEEDLSKVFSDVQAARYVHGIGISPKDLVDPNADILLEIESINPQTLTTHCKLFYRFIHAGNLHTELIGTVNIYVGNVNKNWERNVKHIFYKTEKTKEEMKFIEEQSKKDWYVDYVIKKHEKMNLILKHGIFRKKDLYYAELKKAVYDELKDLASIGVLNKKIIKNSVSATARKMKLVQSIWGEELITNDIEGIMDMEMSLNKLKGEIQKLKKSFSENKITENFYFDQLKKFEKAMQTINEGLSNQKNEIELCININKQFHIDRGTTI